MNKIGHYLKIANDDEIKRHYGNIALSNLLVWNNIQKALNNMNTKEYFSEVNTSAYHNLCTILTSPPDAGALLGLGLQFCIKLPNPHKISLNEACERFFATID